MTPSFSPAIDRLTVTDLACVRGGRLVLSDLSLEVFSGQALVIKGPNGAGKSTLLRVLAGLVEVRAGDIVLAGSGVTEETERPEHVHYIGHLDAVKPTFTVRENIAFWAAYYGASSADTIDAAMDALALAGLHDLPAQFLSAGQKKRTALARLLVAPRPIWLLDEPSVSLDVAARLALVSIINGHTDRGGIVLVTSHEEVALERSKEFHLNPVPRSASLAAEEGLV